MPERVEGKVALIVGGGQAVADLRLEPAQETVDQIKQEGGDAIALEVDVTSEESCKKLIEDTLAHFGRLDVLHNNVGAGLSLGDATVDEITTEAWDRIVNVNLRGMIYTAKYALPALRASGHGSIVNISSMAALHEYPRIGYKATKSAVIALTENLAAANAKYNLRANAILPGKINTPMAIEPRVATGRSREEVVATRDAMVPLGGKMGTGWDVANAALFLHSDDASFITGIHLPVDGGENVMGGAG